MHCRVLYLSIRDASDTFNVSQVSLILQTFHCIMKILPIGLQLSLVLSSFAQTDGGSGDAVLCRERVYRV